jgi:hypothetical protein
VTEGNVGQVREGLVSMPAQEVVVSRGEFRHIVQFSTCRMSMITGVDNSTSNKTVKNMQILVYRLPTYSCLMVYNINIRRIVSSGLLRRENLKSYNIKITFAADSHVLWFRQYVYPPVSGICHFSHRKNAVVYTGLIQLITLTYVACYYFSL